MKTAFGLGIPETLEEVCDPNRVALLVYDMQVGILSQIKKLGANHATSSQGPGSCAKS
jgi:hypothetical protein